MTTTPVFLPGKTHAQRSLVGYSPWDPKESDTAEHTYNIPLCGYTTLHFSVDGICIVSTFLAIMNHAAINNCIQDFVFAYVFISFEAMSRY